MKSPHLARVFLVALVCSGFAAAIPSAAFSDGVTHVAAPSEMARRGTGGDYYAVLRGAKIAGRGTTAFYELSVKGLADETAQISIILPEAVGFEEIFEHGQFFDCAHPPIGEPGTIECSALILGDDLLHRRIVFSVSVPPESTAADFVIRASVSGPGIDPEPSNNVAEVTTGIVDASSFTSDVSLSFEGPVRATNSFDAAFLRLVNNGPEVAVGIRVEAGASMFRRPSRGVVVQSVGDTVARWHVDALGPGESATLVLQSPGPSEVLSRSFQSSITGTDSADTNTANDSAAIDYSYAPFENCSFAEVTSYFEPTNPVAGDTVVAFVSAGRGGPDTYLLVDIPIGMRLVKTIVPGVGMLQAPPVGSDAGTAILFAGDNVTALVLILEATTTVRELVQIVPVGMHRTLFRPGEFCILDSGAIAEPGIAQIAGLETVSWLPPDPSSGGDAPPRSLSVGDGARPSAGGPARRGGDATLVGYNIYRSHVPGVPIAPSNLFTSVGPTQTSVGVPAAQGGSFFRVTACYATGKGGASNEAEEPARTPGPVLSRLPKVGPGGVTAKGTGFTPEVNVFVDGIPFVSPAKVKAGNTKVKQKGNLLVGLSADAYLRQSGSSELIIRNSDGGTVRARIQP